MLMLLVAELPHTLALRCRGADPSLMQHLLQGLNFACFVEEQRAAGSGGPQGWLQRGEAAVAEMWAAVESQGKRGALVAAPCKGARKWGHQGNTQRWLRLRGPTMLLFPATPRRESKCMHPALAPAGAATAAAWGGTQRMAAAHCARGSGGWQRPARAPARGQHAHRSPQCGQAEASHL